MRVKIPRVQLRLLVSALLFVFVLGLGWSLQAQSNVSDPGVRGGAPGAGGPIPGLTQAQNDLFDFVTGEFAQLHSVTGDLPGEEGNGLGPTFNLNGCAGCHAFPAVGGTGPAVNPQIAVASLDGAKNSIPSFITLNGPVREARFVRNPDGTPDGGVHALFTLRGRVDARGCNASQPDFASALAGNNVIFRIPTPLFGDGLIDNIPEEVILDNRDNQGSLKSALGISGRENRNGNDGTITRFGWKAQNKSLLIFSGEAYNVEMGVTNELFPTERSLTSKCNFNTTPEDHLVFEDNSPTAGCRTARKTSRLSCVFLRPRLRRQVRLPSRTDGTPSLQLDAHCAIHRH